eukprot:COSAG06_NODE_2656_length_6487_cov_109.872260_11_plen_51_part_00
MWHVIHVRDVSETELPLALLVSTRCSQGAHLSFSFSFSSFRFVSFPLHIS